MTNYKLNIDLITREAVAILAMLSRPTEIVYLPTAGQGTKVGVNSPVGTLQRQKHVELIIEPKDYLVSLDDFSEKKLMPAMTILWAELADDKIAYTHTLVLPKNLRCSFCIYDQFALRGIEDKKIPNGQLPSYKGESEEIKIRFDILYSRAIDQ